MSQAFTTPTTPDVRPFSRPRTIFVATNNCVDLETKALGEDYAEIRGIEVAYRLLMGRLNRARTRCDADESRLTIKDMLLMLPDVRHDSCLAETLTAARDAAYEARIVPTVIR